jgi:hypothetical protein
MNKYSDDHATLLLDRRWSFGLYDQNTDVDSRLFRPYYRIVESGGPIGTLNYLFLRTGEPLPRNASRGFRLQKLWNDFSPTRHNPIYRTLMRLLGTLCYSPRGMLLYFPGYRGTFITGYDRKFEPINRREPFMVDHFSLEPNFARWHMTATDRSRVQRLNVMPLNGDLVFWFAMSVQRVSEFEPIHRQNSWSFKCPDNDAERRVSDIGRACDGAVFQIVESPALPSSDDPTFWHLEFDVSRSPVDGYPAPPLHLPPKPLADINSSSRQIPARSHVVRLPHFHGAVVISATILSGKLSVPVLLTHA